MRTLAAIMAAFLLGCVAGHTAAPKLPTCFEDEVLTRFSVPGPWRCVPVDALND